MAKRSKRVVLTATIQHPHNEAWTLQQFFAFKAEHADEAQSAVRTRFARRHNVEPDAVTISTAPEKLNYRATFSGRAQMSADDYNERNAVEYARWLAQRDGIALPAGAAGRAVWGGFHSATKITKRKWGAEQATFYRRVQAVEFGKEERQSTYYGSGRTTFKAAARVDIPHWDWEPREPVEYTESIFA